MITTGASHRGPVTHLFPPEKTNVSADPPANGQTPVLELKGLSKSFGGLHAVRGVTFKIMPGTARPSSALPNGAGKTTLFNLITGIFPASSGQVVLFGQDVTGWQSHRRTALGMARTLSGDQPVSAPHRPRQRAAGDPGSAAVKFVMWRFMSSYREVYDKAHRLLEQASFMDRANTEVRYLSHGEQRQLEIVLGWRATRTSFFSTNRRQVCPRESVEMTKFLMGLDPNLAILLIEHDMDVVFDVADEISVLHFGEVLETGAPEQIKNSQKVQEIYLGTG